MRFGTKSAFSGEFLVVEEEKTYCSDQEALCIEALHWNKRFGKQNASDITGVCVGIYYEGMYMVKVILAEKRHFECPNEKVEENGLVTKSSILSKESLGWPNRQIQIHKYKNMCI